MRHRHPPSLDGLPTSSHPWEIGAMPTPVTIDGVDVESMLVVAERGTGAVRAAGPLVRGEPLMSVIGAAFTDPAPPCVPARPERVLCSDPDLVRRLTQELEGSGVSVQGVDDLPAVTAALRGLAEHFAPASAPGIHCDVRMWASVIQTLEALALWQRLDDDVVFRFRGLGELEDPCATVLGRGGLQLGVSLFPSARDHAVFLEAARGSEALMEEVEVLMLQLDPLAELSPLEQYACTEAGLVTPGGLAAHVQVLAGGELRPAHDDAQRVLLAALQGIIGLAATHASALGHEAVSRVVPTHLGPVEVQCERGDGPLQVMEVPLVTAEHSLGVGPMVVDDGRTLPALVIKLRKRDAERVARQLAAVDELVLLPHVEGWGVHGIASGEPLGMLVMLRSEQAAAELLRSGEAVLCVSAGGARRPRVRSQDLLSVRVVAMRDGGEGAQS